MSTGRDLRRAFGELGEMIARGGDASDADLSRFRPYREDPVGFDREVLGGEPWEAQVEVMRAVLEEDRVVWLGGNAVGKDWVVASLSLWWAYSVDGIVLITGPTARQVHEVVMRKELPRPFHRAGLPGELYTTALRIKGDEASILAATSTEAGHLTGHHGERVLAILTEAQDVEPHAWEGLMACATGAEDRLLAVGNPLRPSGRFYEVARPGSGWRAFRTSAFEHPNLDPDADRWIPGGPSKAWVTRMRDTYGEESPIWRARVEGEFPSTAVHGLFRLEWLEEAGRRWTRLRSREDGDGDGEPLVAALDPSRMGADASVLAFRRGDVLETWRVWEGALSTSDLIRGVVQELRERGFRRHVAGERDFDMRGRPRRIGGQKARGVVVVDEPGLGGPVLDRLKELGFAVRAFNGGKRANGSDRFFNRRAESYWTLARRLEEGEVALPPDDRLREELLAVEYAISGSGRVQLESKDDVRSRIGRSPDRADAAAMLFTPPVEDEKKKRTKVGYWSFG